VSHWNDDFPNSQQAIQSRQVDAALVLAINGRILVPAHAEAFAAQNMKGVEMPEEDLKAAKEENELINWGRIRNEDLTEPGQFDSVNSLLLASHIAGPPRLDSDLVYEMVSIILENQEELGQFHPVLEEYGLGEDRLGFDGMPPINWHEGAVQYFEETDIEYPRS